MLLSCVLFAIGALIGSAVGGDGFIYIIGLEILDINGIESIAIMKVTSFCISVYAISRRFLKSKSNESSEKIPNIKKYIPLWMLSSLLGSYITTLCNIKIIFILIITSSTLMLIYKIHSIRSKNKKGQRIIKNDSLMKYPATLIAFYIGFFGPGGGSFFVFIATTFTSMSIKNVFFINRSIIMISNAMPILFFAIKGLINYNVLCYLIIPAIIGCELSLRLIENNKNGEKILSRLLIVILFFISIKYSYILIQKYS
jgi:uncharacterized membrane protein YfcA